MRRTHLVHIISVFSYIINFKISRTYVEEGVWAWVKTSSQDWRNRLGSDAAIPSEQDNLRITDNNSIWRYFNGH